MHLLEAGTIRILKPDGSTAGTGFLVAKQLVVTCAHVVVYAGDTIQMQFTGRSEILSARVNTENYRDPDNGDIVFLSVESVPDSIMPLRLGMAEHSLSGNPFRAFGYPSVGEIEGVHARGETLGIVTENGQRLIQLRSVELNQGHSGAAVWDEQRGVVVGMVVSVYKSDASGKLRDTAFAVPSEALWEVCPEVRPSETAPYLGLENFTGETAQFFFGREALTEKLLSVLRGGCRFLAVFGPSGSGKSSLVRAGLLPSLKKGQLPVSQKWAQITIRPTDNPFEQMRAKGLDPIDINGYLKLHPDVERVVLFIDQFEELFTLCRDELRDRFTRDLASALERSRLVLILCMRDDFYSVFHAKAAPLAESEHLKIENVPGNLQRAELIEMIERPAKTVGLALEEGLTEVILNDVTMNGEARSSILPLLEFALTQLWKKRRDGLMMHEAYQSIGGVTGSLARWADDAYSDLPKADQSLAESLLTSLVHLGDESLGLPDTCRRSTLAELATSNSARRIIKYFADRRLIITSGETVELVHDALVREWGRLQDWIKSNRDNLRLKERVSETARQWDATQRKDDGLLYRGWRLKEIVALSVKHSLNPLENAFIAASILAERRQGFQRIGSVLAVAALLIILAILGPGRWAYYEYQRQRVENERQLIPLEGGEIIFGTDSPNRAEDEPAIARINVDTFSIESIEVTNSHYRSCVEADICENPKDTKFYDQLQYEQHPVVYVTFEQAELYCVWLGRRLPSTYEWERAARGLNGRSWPWGESPLTKDTANLITLTDPEKAEWFEPSDTLPVASLEQGATRDGIYDLLGNVWEWTSTKIGEDVYILRGGSWQAVIYRITNISKSVGSQADRSVGFRCAY